MEVGVQKIHQAATEDMTDTEKMRMNPCTSILIPEAVVPVVTMETRASADIMQVRSGLVFTKT